VKKIRVAVIGQPNVGKSTLFNALTKGHVIVTNWPGTTVSKNEGIIKHGNYEIHLVDLPGIYGLTAFTLEEKISRNFIVEENPDVIVVLVDSLTLIRTLYLALDILERTKRVVIGVTKVDEAHSRGIHINFEILEKALGVPVVSISAIKGIGLEELIKKIISAYESNIKGYLNIDYGELNTYIEASEALLRQNGFEDSSRWLAVKIFEGDPETLIMIKSKSEDLYKALMELREEALRILRTDPAVIVSRSRFKYAEDIGKSCLIQIAVKKKKVSKIFYHPVFAPIISIVIILVMFMAAFTVNTGFPITYVLKYLGLSGVSHIIEEYSISSLMEKFIEHIANILESILGKKAITLFIVDAVLGGLGAILLFLPLIMIVMAILGALEDSGILTRLAVGVHMLFEKVGFSGHALFPLSISLGCNVPGILVTRAVPSSTERVRLIMLLPFIPCQARLVVLLALATAVKEGFLVLALSYIVAFIVFFALGYALYLWSLKRGEVVEIRLLLEQPPLHRPIPRVVWWYTWWHTKHFLVKAGTIIFMANLLFWLLTHVSPSLSLIDTPSESLGALFSKNLTPILTPLGIVGENTWIIVLALIAGFLAKEIFITTLLIVTGAESIREAFITIGISEHSIITLAIFITLYVPCLATIATIYSETRSYKLTVGVVVIMLIVAYTSALLTNILTSILTR
jgi:ferrous iron transport protein B